MRGNFDEARNLVNEHADIMRDLGLVYLSWTNSMARWDIEMLAGDGASAEYAVRVPYDASPLSVTDQDLSPMSRGSPTHSAHRSDTRRHSLFRIWPPTELSSYGIRPVAVRERESVREDSEISSEA